MAIGSGHTLGLTMQGYLCFSISGGIWASENVLVDLETCHVFTLEMHRLGLGNWPAAKLARGSTLRYLSELEAELKSMA